MREVQNDIYIRPHTAKHCNKFKYLRSQIFYNKIDANKIEESAIKDRQEGRNMKKMEINYSITKKNVRKSRAIMV